MWRPQLNNLHRCFFVIIEMLWKIFTQSVYILCRNREDLCSCFWKYFLCFSKCVAAPRNISMFFNESAAASEKISMNDCFWKKMCSWYFLSVWLLLETFQYFLMNVQLLLKDINERLLLKSIKRKKCAGPAKPVGTRGAMAPPFFFKAKKKKLVTIIVIS